MNVFRLLAAALVSITLVAGAPIVAAQTPTPFGSEIEVSRVLTEVRVVDSRGNPIPGLQPTDFRVEIDGEPSEVRSAVWVASTAEVSAAVPTPDPSAQGPMPAEPQLEGRNIVIVFQIDFGLHVSRTVGIVRMAPRAAEFVRALGPGDRVALLSYCSNLRLHSDFTQDHEALAQMITTQRILRADAEPPPPSPPLLGDHLDVEAAEKAAEIHDALEVLGRALSHLPGPKSLVFFGFGLGHMTAGANVTLGDGYERAMRALTASRTAVFSLDITDADYHSLAFGLRTVSRDTGGFYAKTHLFPEPAMERLTRVISSYYELEIVPPPGIGDEFTIEVKVDRPRVEVYVRQYHPSESH